MAIYGTGRISVQMAAVAGEGNEIVHSEGLDPDQPLRSRLGTRLTQNEVNAYPQIHITRPA
jgi:hypothetical protein